MKLNNQTLNEIGKKDIHIPSYDRTKLKRGLVHIGFGNFHRAHYLTYLDEMLCSGKTEYGIFEIDVMPIREDYLENIRKQDYLYSVLSLASDGSRQLRVNGPIMGYANETTEPGKVMEVLTSPETVLVTLTITEKGYCYLDDKGILDFDNPLIRHDIETNEAPKSAVGLISAALAKRKDANLPLTIMSCDNVPENGRMLEECIKEFCRKKYPSIIPWLDENTAFPCTMVDRITPGTTEADIERVRNDYSLDDRCNVHCEDFIQWVIEKKAATEIPDYSLAGALVVDDVKPYELMKIRLLNGSHSALSYPSYMMGIKMVHEGIGNPLIHDFIRNRYMEEITATLSPVDGIDMDRYKDKLVSRFSNPYIADTILRLASDGSKKIANALLRPLEEALHDGKKTDAMAFALSLWEYYYLFKDENGNGMPLDDPKADELKSVAEEPSKFLKAAGLGKNALESAPLMDRMKFYLENLKEKGVRETITGWL